MPTSPLLSSLIKRDLIKLIQQLEKKVILQEKQILILRNQLLPANKHQASATGHDAEKFVAALLNGQSTLRNADHDLVVKGRKRLEVKGSKCNVFMTGNCIRRRWTWHNFLGTGKQQKNYQRLILVGEAPDDLRSEYKDPKSPFVFFDLPIRIAREIAEARKDHRGNFGFPLMARPSSSKSSVWGRKVWEYQVTQEELVTRYRVDN